MKKTVIRTASALLIGVAAQGSAIAAIVLVDIGANPSVWSTVVSGLQVYEGWDLDALDFGSTVESINTPLTASGGGPIPAGFLPDIVTIEGSRSFASAPPIGIAFLYSTVNGYPNTQNAIVANQPTDSLNISFQMGVSAFEFNATTCMPCGDAPGLFDISVTDDYGAITVFSNIPGQVSGVRFGLYGTAGERISLINLGGPGPELPYVWQGNPGIQGGAVIYAPVPEPSTYALMLAGLGAVAFAGKRRRTGAHVTA